MMVRGVRELMGRWDGNLKGGGGRGRQGYLSIGVAAAVYWRSGTER